MCLCVLCVVCCAATGGGRRDGIGGWARESMRVPIVPIVEEDRTGVVGVWCCVVWWTNHHSSWEERSSSDGG